MCEEGDGDADVPAYDAGLGGEVAAIKVLAAVAASDRAVAAGSIAAWYVVRAGGNPVKTKKRPAL
jgi:hypothetical protein